MKIVKRVAAAALVLCLLLSTTGCAVVGAALGLLGINTAVEKEVELHPMDAVQDVDDPDEDTAYVVDEMPEE